MNPFAFGLQESFKVAVQVFIMIGVLGGYKGRLYMITFFALLSGLCLAIHIFPPDASAANLITNFSYVFYIFLLLIPLFKPTETVITILLPLLLFVNESLQTTVLLIDTAQLVGISAYAYAAAALLITAFALYKADKIFSGKASLRSFMNPSEMVLFLATFNLVFGGLDDFTGKGAIPSLQRELNNFLTGVISLIKDSLLIPTNKNLEVPVNIILNFFSSARFAMALTAMSLLIPPVYLFLKLLITPEPETSNGAGRAEIRKRIALYRGELMRRGTPIILSLIVLMVLLHSANLTLNPAYEPPPVPLIAEDGVLRIPLTDSIGDISGGKLCKYSFNRNGAAYRIIVMMRPDGEIAAMADACEICPPRGYVQRGNYLICKYCNTPIPAETLGQAGGCNPIPLSYKTEKDYLLITVEDVIKAYAKAGAKFHERH